jgi:hypothetical protein
VRLCLDCAELLSQTSRLFAFWLISRPPARFRMPGIPKDSGHSAPFRSAARDVSHDHQLITGETAKIRRKLRLFCASQVLCDWIVFLSRCMRRAKRMKISVSRTHRQKREMWSCPRDEGWPLEGGMDQHRVSFGARVSGSSRGRGCSRGSAAGHRSGRYWGCRPERF